MSRPRHVLIIVQRSNGDVFLSSPLIEAIHSFYADCRIDLLVNDDTLGIAGILPHVRTIHSYSYGWKKLPCFARIRAELGLLSKIRGRYDLAINLTASDRSVLYALLAGKVAISPVDGDRRKSWWKRWLLDYSYPAEADRHVVRQNLAALDFLEIPSDPVRVSVQSTPAALDAMREKLSRLGISKFFIFHPTAQYDYKVYPEELRKELLRKLDSLGIPLVVTGAASEVDRRIKSTLPVLPNLFDFIGETTLAEYVALSELSSAYIGMDTLNMHIAAAQNKRIFAVFGPTLPVRWSPWSNRSGICATGNQAVQTYDDITLFQAEMPCVACGMAGCDDSHGKSECLYRIDPDVIFEQIRSFASGLDAESSPVAQRTIQP